MNSNEGFVPDVYHNSDLGRHYRLTFINIPASGWRYN